MKIYSKKTFWGGVGLALLGAANMALDLLRADLDGAGLLLVGALLFFGLGMVRRSLSQAAVEEDRLEAEDERNRLIELKTRSQTLRWTRLFSVLLLLLLLVGGKLTGEPTLIAVAIGPGLTFSISMIAEIICFAHYESKN